MAISDVLTLADRIYGAMGTPYALELQQLLRKKDWVGLFSHPMPHADTYANACTFKRDAIASSFLKKWESASKLTKVNTKAAAIQKWYQVERQNALTNAHLAPLLDGYADSADLMLLQELLPGMRSEIKRIVGRVPDEIVPKFSSGSTLTDKHPYTTLPDKLGSELTVTREAAYLEGTYSGTAWARAQAQRYRNSMRILDKSIEEHFTVPKKWDIDRNAAMGPNVLVAYQLGVGNHFRERVRRYLNWNLSAVEAPIGTTALTAQDIHRRMAKVASVDQKLATMDLSDASDRWTTIAVKLLLPSMWYDLLSTLRVKFTRVEGRNVYLHKFSSMGNGFTFELETILFWSVIHAVMTRKGHKPVLGQNCGIFGDDIIVPEDCYDGVYAVLKCFGHEPNAGKCFRGTTRFRESCGGDFFDGHPVRGYYLKKGVLNEPQEIIAVANGLRAACQSCSPTDAIWADLRPIWIGLLGRLPRNIRACKGPEWLGDSVIHDSQRHHAMRVRNSITQYRVYRPVTKFIDLEEHFISGVVLASALLGQDRRVVWRNSVRYPSVSGYELAWTPNLEDTHR